MNVNSLFKYWYRGNGKLPPVKLPLEDCPQQISPGSDLGFGLGLGSQAIFWGAIFQGSFFSSAVVGNVPNTEDFVRFRFKTSFLRSSRDTDLKWKLSGTISGEAS